MPKFKLLKPITKKQFDRMSPKNRRIRVAEDTITTIEAKMTVPQAGCFLYSFSSGASFANRPAGVIHNLESGIHCQACAIGSMAVAACQRFNGHTSGDLEDSAYEDLRTALEGVFFRKQLMMIECAFERTGAPAKGYGYKWEDGDMATLFGKQHPDPYDRLLAIMQNIIDNDGTFVPSQEYVVS